MAKEDGIYAMRFASQQMLIDKLQQENKKLSENYDRIYNENCKLSEEHNINDISLLDENYKLKKEIDILLNVQEECEKSLHKIRELKRELNKVNDENEKLQQEVNYLSKEVGRWNSYYDDEFNKNQKLKHNWNELKKYLHNVDVVIDNSENYGGRFINYDELIDKTQEIEQGEK